MISVLKSKAFIFSFSCWIVLLLACGYFYYAASKVRSQFISGDDNFSSYLDQDLKNLLNQKVGQQPNELFLEVKALYPMVSKLHVKRIGLAKNHVYFTSQDLMYRLGEDLVFSKNNEIFLANNFNNAILKKTPTIYLHKIIDATADVEPELKIFLNNIPEFIIQNYDIHWYGINQIILINKEHHEQQMIVKYDQILTIELLETCQKLITKYQLHTNKKCVGNIKTDLRFERQIIVSC